MKKTYKITGILLTVLLVATSSCSKDKTPEPILPPSDCTDTVFYSTDIEPLIMQNCTATGCHNNSGAGGYIFNGYASIEGNKDIILKTISHADGVTPMPQGAPMLSTQQIDLFRCWIVQGSPNN